MAYATGKLARWHTKLQKREFDVVNPEGLNNQESGELLRFKKIGEDRSQLKEEAPVLIIE